MNSQLDLSSNGTAVDFQPAYDRIADLENTYLEESVLAGIIVDAGVSDGDKALGMDYLAALLPTSAAFQHRSHRLIYACCLDLHSAGLKPNLQAVALRLAADGLLQEVGGRSKLAQLLDRDTFAEVHLKQNAELLREAYQRRRLADGLNDINKEKDFDTALEKALKEIELLRQMRSPDLMARLSAQSMRLLIIKTLERNLGEDELFEALNILALDSRWHPKEVRELVELVESDLDCESSRTERYQDIELLEEYKGRTLTLSRYLPFSIANPMQNVAQWLGVPSAALLLELLVGVASCAHPETRVIVKESIGFIEPMIIYGGLVTESGQRKSPTINAVFDAIKQLQFEEEERFREDSIEYERSQKEWNSTCPGKDSPSYQAWLDEQPTPPPALREFYLDIATVEAIDKLKGQQPDTAFVLLKDELSGLFGSYGAYKNGKGEDREAILSGWNGRGRKKNLKGGERVSTLYDAMSIFGAIQDSKLTQMMGSFDDDQGDWGRFLWALIPLKALRLPESDTTFQLAFLKSLFERIRALSPQKYRFAFDAQRLYEEFHWQLEQRRVAHSQRGMRAAIAKMEGYCARLALALHLIWELVAGRIPAPYIPRERVEQAIRLTEFFLSQVTLIHSSGAAALGEGGLTPRLSAILGKLKQFGSLTAGKLQAAISWLRKVSPIKLRDCLTELAKLGYGTLVGKGNRLKLVWNQSKTTDTTDSTTDKTTDSALGVEALDLRELQGEALLTTDTTDIGELDSCSGSGSSKEVSSINSSTTKSSLEEGGRLITPQINHQHRQIRQKACPLPIPAIPHQQYQEISSSPIDLDKSSVPAPDSVSVGESVDSSTGVSNPANNGNDPDDDPPGENPVLSGYSPQKDDGSNDVMDVSAPLSAGATGSSGNGSGELLTTEEMADWHSRLKACQTLDDAINFDYKLDALSKQQRYQFESSVTPVLWAWLWNLPVASEQQPESARVVTSSESALVDEKESVPEFESVPQPALVDEPVPEPATEPVTEAATEPSLEELRSLLLACKSLVQLQELKRKHKQTITKAYDSMSEKEQERVDVIAALAVPHRVFKYLGDTIVQGSSRLLKGALVYIAPLTQMSANAYSAPVWAINGVTSGWVHPIHVSISLLHEVVKAVLPDPESDNGNQQLGLI